MLSKSMTQVEYEFPEGGSLFIVVYTISRKFSAHSRHSMHICCVNK